MNPTAYIKTLFRGDAPFAGERPSYDFDLISRYFYNRSTTEEAFQTIDAETTADLDINALFERIDRTASKVGQQCLYARLRTLQGPEDAQEFGRNAERFGNDPALARRCVEHLKPLAAEDAYDLQNLVYDTPVRVRRMGLVYLLSLAAVAAIVLGIFVHPLLLLLFPAVFAANLYIHYSNKINILRYTSAVKQLSRALKAARALAAEGVPGTDEAAPAIAAVARVERRSRVVGTQGDGANELAAIVWLLLELVKVAFNIEVILFHRFVGSIAACSDAIHGTFRFIGETDAAMSVAQLRAEGATCRPRFTDGKFLRAEEVAHPLIDGCVPNTLILDGTGLLLTGSNMSGKTTFIRTLMLNALLAETIHTCFAAAYEAPYMRLFSSIRIADDIAEGTSYYLQEVLTIKRHLDASEETMPCMFALDELFKGTNTTERIAAGKAVLARLNRGPHVVLVSTHDIELAELHHFREEVVGSELVFDYRLHTGPLTTRNAIRILELYDYPPDLIAEAYAVQERMMGKMPE